MRRRPFDLRHGVVWSLAVWPLWWACGSHADAALDFTTNPGNYAEPNATVVSSRTEGLSIVSSSPSSSCLVSKGGSLDAGTLVGVAPCEAAEAQIWFVSADGTLSLKNGMGLWASADVNGQISLFAPQDGNTARPQGSGRAVRAFLARGHVALADTISGIQASVLATNSAAASGNFVPVVTRQINLTGTDATTTWSLGKARRTGQNALVLDGFSIHLASNTSLCLTGAGSTTGVEPCQGSSTQAWTVNAQGAPQLSGYCLGIDTTGSVSQGTATTFVTCSASDSHQKWVWGTGQWALGGYYLAPATTPPSASAFTPAQLSSTGPVWLLGL